MRYSSRNYSWSCESKPDYASSVKANIYLNGFADKSNLHRYIEAEHSVVPTGCDDEQDAWHADDRATCVST